MAWEIPIIALGTTVTTGRQLGPTQVRIANIRKRVDVATLPTEASKHGLAVCQELFGDRSAPRSDILAIATRTLTAEPHGIAILNLTRMERGKSLGPEREIPTDAVGRLLEALDAERLAIADAIGAEVRTIREHYHLSFDVPVGSVGEMSRAMHRRGDRTLGPTDSQHPLRPRGRTLRARPYGTARPSCRVTGGPSRIRASNPLVRNLRPGLPCRERPSAAAWPRWAITYRLANALPPGLAEERDGRLI